MFVISFNKGAPIGGQQSCVYQRYAIQIPIFSVNNKAGLLNAVGLVHAAKAHLHNCNRFIKALHMLGFLAKSGNFIKPL